MREEPAGGGPVAGLRCGLAEVSAPWLALLAADLPFLTGAQLAALVSGHLVARDVPAECGPAAAPPLAGAGLPGVVLVDAAGRPQWLASWWRASSLRAALAAYDGDSLHGLLAPLSPALTRLDLAAGAAPPWLDCDTPDDLAAARRAWLAQAAESGGGR